MRSSRKDRKGREGWDAQAIFQESGHSLFSDRDEVKKTFFLASFALFAVKTLTAKIAKESQSTPRNHLRTS
jgi:hypothetical protein